MILSRQLAALAVTVLFWLSSAVLVSAADGLPSGIRVTQYAPKSESFPGCTHIAFSGDTEIVTAGDRLFYRTDSQSPFRESGIRGLNDAHSVVFDPHDRLFYATDTGNHRLITFRDPSRSQVQRRLTSLAGVKLQRPHDIVRDPSAGWLYSLNPDSSQVFRFKTAGKTADVLDLSQHLGYSRALTIVNGRLYVIGSSAGAVVEVVDFGKQQYKIRTSFGKKKDATAGSWRSTGLVLNDVDFFQGHWYATSYFCPTYAGNHDYDEKKFIRFKTWRAFEEGAWEDLSQSLPSKVVPYYLTPHKQALFIARSPKPLSNSTTKVAWRRVRRDTPKISDCSSVAWKLSVSVRCCPQSCSRPSSRHLSAPATQRLRLNVSMTQ
jgi:hypothetical protein